MMLILRQKRNNIQKSNNLQEHSTQHMNFFLPTKSSNTIKKITSGMKWSEGEICKLPLKRTSGNLIFISWESSHGQSIALYFLSTTASKDHLDSDAFGVQFNLHMIRQSTIKLDKLLTLQENHLLWCSRLF